MAQLTNADLRKKLEEAQAIIDAQAIELEKQATELGELNAAGVGWLVTTPSPVYAERTLGIQFIRGQAFIRQNQTVEACAVEPLKDSTIEKMKLKPEEVKAIREREKISQAERAVRILENDFGYEVTYFDGTERADKQMKRVVEKRALEYSQALEMLEAQKKAQDAVAPHYMGQSR